MIRDSATRGASERGAVGVLAVAAVLLCALGASAVAQLSTAAHGRARAEAAADLVALAAVSGDAGAVSAVAVGNGARIDRLDVGPDGRVTVQVDAAGHWARAAAAPLGEPMDPGAVPRPR